MNNNREIERKFLVKRLPEGFKTTRRSPIAQGYLAIENGRRHVRLRKKGRTVSLTFKLGGGMVRQEREITLSAKQFAALWPGTIGRRLRKVRHEIHWKGRTIEVDVYTGANRGLIVAEVEFPNQASCRKFQPPPWFGREVTGKRRYANTRLATE